VAARARFRRSVKRNRDLIWVTTIVQAAVAETGGGLDIGDLVLPGDWSTTVGFDRATLMGVRGALGLSQTATGTATDAPGMYLAMYVTDQLTPANQMDPFNAADYSGFDTLYTDVIAGVGTLTGVAFRGMQINIKARRKLTSAQEVRLAASVPTDTATPRFNALGIFRCLLKLDP